ncbi:hypothetical protein D3C84_679670 [compost metagenome]
MHGGVGADVVLLPVQRCTLLIMPFECVGVTGALVTEQAAKRLKPMAVGDQPIPVIVTDLMAKMPKQGAIRFVHLHPYLLAVSVVSFPDIKGDQAIGMAGGRGFSVKVFADEIKCQPDFFVVDFGNDRQPQRNQLRDHPTLRGFHLAPALVVFGDRQVGNGAIKATGDAQRFALIGRKQPVARGR